MEQDGAQRTELPTHRQRTDEGMAAQDREGGGSLLHMWPNTERGASLGIGLRGGQTEEVGGHLDGQGILRGGGQICERKWRSRGSMSVFNFLTSIVS